MSNTLSSKLAVLVHADVVGSTALVQIDELIAHQRMRETFRRLSEAIVTHGGIAHEIRGDALVAEFSKASDAVSASTAFQCANAIHNAGLPDRVRPEVRIGIAIGEVVIADSTITGEGVVLAQRLEQLADPGGVCLQGAVYETIPKRLAFVYENLGEHELKGFDEPVKVYAVRQEPGAGTQPRAKTAGSRMVPERSIAVLPFANMSGDPEQEYFTDGITEDLITELAKLPALLVISRNSTFTYKGRAAKAQDVCHELGVRYMLEGSARKAGERVRITAQLIDGISGGHLWAERYDRGLVDIFALQDEVTGRIVHALELNLPSTAPAGPPRDQTDVPEAYDSVLRGREQYRLFTPDGNLRARRLYQRAIDLDSNYAAAYAGKAGTCLHEWFFGSPEALDQAYDLAVCANALNPSLPLAYEALGNVCLFRRQHGEAVEMAKRWVEAEPGNADAYANLAGALHFSGKPEAVIPLIEKATRLNPFYPFYYILYRGQAYLAMERYEEAREALRRSVLRNPDALPAHLYHAACLGLLGEARLAAEAYSEVHRLCPNVSAAWVQRYFPYKRPADLDRLVEGLRKAGMPG